MKRTFELIGKLAVVFLVILGAVIAWEWLTDKNRAELHVAANEIRHAERIALELSSAPPEERAAAINKLMASIRRAEAALAKAKAVEDDDMVKYYANRLLDLQSTAGTLVANLGK